MTSPALSSSSSVDSAVIEIIRQVLPASERQRPLLPGDRLCDLGISSLRLLSLFLDLEESFDISPVALARLSVGSTIAQIVNTCFARDHLNDVALAS